MENAVTTKGKMSGKRGERISWIAKMILIALPVCWGLFLVWRYGVNVAYLDEMRFMQNRENFLTWSYLWGQHNEHRMLFPKLISYAVGSLSAWNSKAFMYTSQVFLFGLYYVVIRLILQGRKISGMRWIDAVEITCIGMSVYNAAQYENFLWGFQVAWMMIISLGALSYYLFDKYIHSGKALQLVFSMLLAVVVSFSSLHGLAVWGGYIVVILAHFLLRERQSRKTIVTLFLCCVATIVLYFWGWHFVSGHEGYAGKSPNRIADYFLAQIGESVLTTDNPLSYLIAFVLLEVMAICFFYSAVGKSLTERMKFFGPMILGLGAMFLVAAGRSGGIWVVMSRYVTNSMVYLSSTMAMLIHLIRQRIQEKQARMDESEGTDPGAMRIIQGEFRRIMIPAGCLLFASLSVLLVFRNTGMIGTLREDKAHKLEIREVLLNYDQKTMDDYQLIHLMTSGEVDGWVRVFDRMREEHLNAFGE